MYALSHYIALVLLLGAVPTAAQILRTQEAPSRANVPTPVSGDSWLTHISRSFNVTSMGKTGLLGPATESEQAATSVVSSIAPPVAQTALSGDDLYRLNCRGCHGAEGLGAPPEINSVINPVKATSAALVMERMKSRGLDISSSSANELAKEAKVSLLKRLHEGGENMPSFSYLTAAEIKSIITYLNQLAEVPNTPKAFKRIPESSERIGELLVKSTCHICHGATGPNPSEQQIYEGQIPPLEALPSRLDQAQFIRKITQGLPILMGDPATLYRGRMPVFHYITPQEAADAYLYLSYYPPISKARSIPMVSAVQEASGPAVGGGGSAPKTGAQGGIAGGYSDESLATGTVLTIAGLFGLVVMLIGGGFAVTIREFSRMSGQSEQSHIPRFISSEQQPEESPLVHS